MFLLDQIYAIFTVKDIDGVNEDAHQKEIDDAKDTKKEHIYERKNTYLDGLAHLFRATVGTGILGLPYAFAEAGYVVGILGLIFVTYVSLYCASLLAKCQLKMAQKDKSLVPSFQGAVEAAFRQGPEAFRRLAPFTSAATNILLLVGQFGGVCVYFIFIAANFKAAAGAYVDWDIRLWVAMVGVPILALNMVISLKRMVLVSSLGNAIVFFSIGIIFYYMLRDPLTMEGKRPYGDFRDIPQFFGTAFFAGGYINMVLPLQSEMVEPEQMARRLGVLDMNALLTGSLYVVFGLLGYLKYGDQAKASITLNLPGEAIGTTVQLLLSLSVMTGTALQNYITVTILWDDYFTKRITRNKLFFQYFLRVLIVLVTLAVSVSIPNLELLVSLTGILGQVFTGSLPVLIHVFTCDKQDSAWGYVKEFWMDVVSIIFSIFLLVTSMGASVLDLVEFFK